DSTGEKANKIREKAMRHLKQSREALLDAQETLARRGRQAIRATDDYVHDKPWPAIGLAGALGLLLGVLLSRRSIIWYGLWSSRAFFFLNSLPSFKGCHVIAAKSWAVVSDLGGNFSDPSRVIRY